MSKIDLGMYILYLPLNVTVIKMNRCHDVFNFDHLTIICKNRVPFRVVFRM